jgi:hypothetical protein
MVPARPRDRDGSGRPGNRQASGDGGVVDHIRDG